MYRLFRGERLPLALFTALILSLCAPAMADYRIMALGGSITQGIGGEKSYRDPLTKMLDASACEFQMVGSQSDNLTPTDFSSPHEGYSGHRIDYFLEGIEESSGRVENAGIEQIMTSNPDVILIHLGSVDMFVGQPVDGEYLVGGKGGTIAELDELVARIWNSNPDAQLYMADVIPWFGVSASNPKIGEDIQSLSSAITGWIGEKADSRLHLVEVNKDYSAELMQADLIHPNTAGDEFIASRFLSVLRDNGVCPAQDQ